MQIAIKFLEIARYHGNGSCSHQINTYPNFLKHQQYYIVYISWFSVLVAKFEMKGAFSFSRNFSKLYFAASSSLL